MSWDVSVVVTYVYTVNESVYDRNVTWNNQALFFKALGCGFRDLNGQSVAEVLPLVEHALMDIAAHRADYAPLAPDNGWGGIDDVLDVLRGLQDACTAYPDAVVRVE